MHITVFGLTLSSSWGNGHATPNRALLKALHRLGHRVTFYEKDVAYYRQRRDLESCDYCELMLYPSWDDVRGRALRAAAESEVVIVTSYCPEGARIADEVLELHGPLRVFYDMDTPVTLSELELSSGRLDYLRRSQMPEFDLYLSFTGGRILDALEEDWGVQRARPLYGSVDPEVHARTGHSTDFACDLSYMGTYAADRQPKLDALLLEPARRSPQRNFVLAGSLFPWQWTWQENVRRFEHVTPSEHAALFSSSRATLNLTRGRMSEWGYCPSGRLFEAAACGTPIITDMWEGLDWFFTPGAELLAVHKADDVLQALELPQSELDAMAERARQRTLDEHTGEQRARELLAHLEEAGAGSSRGAVVEACPC